MGLYSLSIGRVTGSEAAGGIDEGDGMRSTSPFKDDSELQAYLQRARNGWRQDPTETGSGTHESGPPASRKQKVRRKMNKWEVAYSHALDLQKLVGMIADYKFEPWRFVLAEGVTYTPDFLVVPKEGPLQIHEVKGFMREDARVKLYTASRQFPWFRFFKAVKENGGWVLTEVER